MARVTYIPPLKALLYGRCVGIVLGVSILDSDAVTCVVLNVVGSFNWDVSTAGDGSVVKIGLSVEVVVIRKEVEIERSMEGDTAAADLRGTLVHRKPWWKIMEGLDIDMSSSPQARWT
ncbi:hypothetical protein BDV27DRAFT_151126 [Aspergillus caelatus]|uniref:Uncharacterized protein n=1 Tax=Aspergillus caelatus TaxID=61420 RepID=A0A5N6ZJ95_9EURO|nr:uncharacterized protein BDV27DRAFT_151126 [Aspergillus caelatus]KAE8357681.1 hypothetical protein BDV27DRAFT_151126 [Aspergillus caelatus]